MNLEVRVKCPYCEKKIVISYEREINTATMESTFIKDIVECPSNSCKKPFAVVAELKMTMETTTYKLDTGEHEINKKVVADKKPSSNQRSIKSKRDKIFKMEDNLHVN